ncbi:hypothetical protein KC360_g8486 [Hortaea werneckii]|nr:hypothetical protein KC359_g8715 [Hortaea werneckii]KAI7167708.1 hypothetical protein KC360_g8486 [Hortaea werneckii]KAI7511000.1 hypothetical protein KC347_g3770 [Hortaea werneckii]
MALKSPLMPSPTNGLSSAFSPYSDSPNSPAPYQNNFQTASNRSSGPSDSLAPPPSPYPQQIEPSPVDSNGTESTEIEEDAQEEGEVKSAHADGEVQSPDIEITSPEETVSPQSATSDRVHKIDTQLPARFRSDSAKDEPQSVIHAPATFRSFGEAASSKESEAGSSEATVVSLNSPQDVSSPIEKKLAAVSPVKTDVPRVIDRSTPRAQSAQELDEEWRQKRRTSSLEDVPEELDRDGDEAEDPDTAGLIGDGAMNNVMQQSLDNAEEEVTALRTALSECWTLCNTLATLSSTHRQRTFKFAGKQGMQEQAWRSCWRLCQQLYDYRDADHASQVIPTLELCRDFCQSLFDARQRGDEASDSVLRVSFELNNHLYNTHPSSLPEAFNERTLDFYITMCHRLMKQRTSLPQETDALLRACWSLAEMLFNLRQSTREGTAADEELLGSAVQACWELCDLFREGWTQIRPERGTPRPSQTTFQSTSPPQNPFNLSSNRSEPRSNSSMSNRQYHDAPSGPAGSAAAIVPETPTTIFDDTTSSAASSPDSVTVPNILVLGPASSNSTSHHGSSSSSRRAGHHHERWSSNASVLSGYSESVTSQRTSSTATAGKKKKNQPSSSAAASSAEEEEAHLTRLRYLLLKAGMQTGYPRHHSSHPSNTHTNPNNPPSKSSTPTPPAPSSSSSSSSSSSQPVPHHTENFQTYISRLPPTAFGPLPWQRKLLSRYQDLVRHDETIAGIDSYPPRRLGAGEVAGSVGWLVGTATATAGGTGGKGGKGGKGGQGAPGGGQGQGGAGQQWAWMRDLYRLVFGFGVEEGERMRGMGGGGGGVQV